jgi:hypothetical protein
MQREECGRGGPQGRTVAITRETDHEHKWWRRRKLHELGEHTIYSRRKSLGGVDKIY